MHLYLLCSFQDTYDISVWNFWNVIRRIASSNQLCNQCRIFWDVFKTLRHATTTKKCVSVSLKEAAYSYSLQIYSIKVTTNAHTVNTGHFPQVINMICIYTRTQNVLAKMASLYKYFSNLLLPPKLHYVDHHSWWILEERPPLQFRCWLSVWGSNSIDTTSTFTFTSFCRTLSGTFRGWLHIARADEWLNITMAESKAVVVISQCSYSPSHPHLHLTWSLGYFENVKHCIVVHMGNIH